MSNFPDAVEEKSPDLVLIKTQLIVYENKKTIEVKWYQETSTHKSETSTACSTTGSRSFREVDCTMLESKDVIQPGRNTSRYS
jgi:hypothetical protein